MMTRKQMRERLATILFCTADALELARTGLEVDDFDDDSRTYVFQQCEIAAGGMLRAMQLFQANAQEEIKGGVK